MKTERQQPDALSSSTDSDQPNVEKPLDIPEQETEVPDQPNNAENVTEKATNGAPLDQVPSQAAKMGKNKIIVVMTALCVRNLPMRECSGSTESNLVSYSSWLYSWRLWTWYVLIHTPLC